MSVSLEPTRLPRSRKATTTPRKEQPSLNIHIQTIIQSGSVDMGEPVPIEDEPTMTPADLDAAQREEIKRIRHIAPVQPDVDPEERLERIRERENESSGNADRRCGYD